MDRPPERRPACSFSEISPIAFATVQALKLDLVESFGRQLAQLPVDPGTGRRIQQQSVCLDFSSEVESFIPRFPNGTPHHAHRPLTCLRPGPRPDGCGVSSSSGCLFIPLPSPRLAHPTHAASCLRSNTATSAFPVRMAKSSGRPDCWLPATDLSPHHGAVSFCFDASMVCP